MLNEWEEFQRYIETPVYASAGKNDHSYLGRFTFEMFAECTGLTRVLTVLARGYLFHDADGAILAADPRDRIGMAWRALCAWCSVPDNGKLDAKNKWKFKSDFTELHEEFPELVDERGGGWYYGYDTPESFSRAFTRFHGVTPTQARRGETVKSFSRLSVKLILSGGSTMNYRIEKKDAFKIICKKVQVTKPQGDTAVADISAFWNKCSTDGTMEQICKYGKFDTLHGVLGICFSDELAGSGFPYGIGSEYNGAPLNGEKLDILEIPAYTYAVFTCRGKMPDSFKDTYKKICTEFFPQSNYDYGHGVELEVYPSADVQDPNYTCEIWVAVKEKQ